MALENAWPGSAGAEADERAAAEAVFTQADVGC
jgi:hypothetical protein